MKPISAARIVATAIAPCGVAICAYVYAIRPWHLRWGATTAEIERTWPGDGEVSHPKLAATRAVMIKAPPEDVWPWLVQMGKGRAGFYSYTWIEHLMGLEIENTDRILPEFQQLKAGDRIPDLGPVTALEPNHFLLLSGHEPWGDLS